jgi:hypothetical protein
MATTAGSVRVEAARAEERAQPVGGLRYDWAVAALCGWIVAGFYLDAWAHNHEALESFFTPWHAALYSGLLATMVFLGPTVALNRTRGYALVRSVPDGYELSVVGALIFFVAGFADMLWHEIFGVEQNIEAALSPTHITLAFGTVLLVSGPIRAAWRRQEGRAVRWSAMAPTLLSLTYTLSVFTVLTQWAHPFVNVWAGADWRQSYETQMLGILSVVLQSGLLMGFVLLAVRRWELPFGSLALVFGLISVLLSFMQDQFRFIPVGVAAGLVADGLVMALKPSVERARALRAFAFLVPAVLFALYFAILGVTEGIGWTVELWTGSIVFAGVTGLVLSYLLVAPEQVEAQE